MDIFDSRAQKIRNIVYGSIFTIGTIIFFMIYVKVIYENFLLEFGYDPSVAASTYTEQEARYAILMMLGWAAALSSALLTFVANIIGSIVEAFFGSRQDAD